MAEAPAWLRRPIVWEIPLLVVLALFMLWIRTLGHDILFSGGGIPLGQDPDDIYHFRETVGAVRAFPAIPRFDPWTFYPHGTTTGQFGTLYDWLVAAFVVLFDGGKGAPDLIIARDLAWAPPIIGSLLIIPFYYLARRLMGRPGAIVATLTLAVLPGDFLYRSIIGSTDHDGPQDLAAILAMLGLLIAVERMHAARDALRARDWRALRLPLLWTLVGGVAFAANLYVWPPGILFVAIAAVWLGVVVLLKEAQGQDALGYAAGGALVLAITGALMVPVIESTYLGEFTTYGILHPLACFASAIGVLVIYVASRRARDAGWPRWAVPAGFAGIFVAAVVAIFTIPSNFLGSIRWGLSWVSGIGVTRTTLTISEARSAEFFCDPTRTQSCLAANYGPLTYLGVVILALLLLWTLWKRRPADVLLLVWSALIFQATATQAHFAHYLAISLALLTGWLAARIGEAVGLTPSEDEAATKAAGKPARGRKAKAASARSTGVTPLRALCVAAVLLLVLPGNVFASNGAVPGWQVAAAAASPGDLWKWQPALEWMRDNTPDAGVDLGKVYPTPPLGALPDYPPNAYGVLSWWDYGFWIETLAERPPVANPFQQAAPFASIWFTERDPAQAEKLLTDWEQGKPPVRYVFIDDEMATGKFGAITVWAHTNNASRDQWADGGFVTQKSYQMADGTSKQLYTPGPEYTESMMGRLYDQDGADLSHYRLVWEDPGYNLMGDVVDQNGQVRCFHDIVRSGSCPVNIDPVAASRYQPGTVLSVASDTNAYDLNVQSRLKLFERVAGAHLTGTATPGARVTAAINLQVRQPGNVTRPFQAHVSTTAGPDGAFDLVFPYGTVGFLDAKHGGTNTIVVPTSQVLVDAGGGHQALVDVPDDAVLHGGNVAVRLA
ncbi:MAG: dolichyl-phosphooligosaccharide-protein glycotransferase [Thermoplasmata archaeon]|jgi:dolichyl-diphosphooligosaccharide--protein glycosyltransferase|nr:dolichyl-phosphooligosaccharide-protein glycotransferase [Thermoplasmata archaeon]